MVGRIFIGLFWIGCSIPESDFPEEVAETYCDRLWRCDAEDAQDIYGAVGECEDFWADITEAWLDVSDFLGEEYVEEKGHQCIRGIRWASCDDIEDVELDEYCDDVLE